MLTNFIYKKLLKIPCSFAAILLVVLSNLSCEKEVFTGLPPEPETTNFGSLFLDSEPQNAFVYVDSKNSGYITPDTVKWLKEGTHTITLKHELFGDTTFTVSVSGSNDLAKFINFKNNPKFYGTIHCTSNPTGAAIYLNNENTGQVTTASFVKLPGEYTIKYTYPEHRADSSKFILYGGIKRTINIILEDTSVWVSYKFSNSQLPSNIVSSIATDQNKNKWIGTRDKGVAVFNNKNWTIYNTKNSNIIGDFVYCINVDQDNSVWVGTSAGLSVYKNGVWQSFSEDYLKKYITDIAFGINGDVWVATEVGLAKYSSGTWQLFTTQNSGIAGNLITGVAVDNLGRIWAGAMSFGVSMYDGISWKTYTVSNMGVATAIGNEIRHIAVDKNNNVWVAHAVNYKQGIVGGLTKFDGTSWASITYPNVLTNYIESIYVDDFNTVWIGTTAGLAEVTEQDILTTYSVQNSQIPVGRVTGVLVENNNRVWVTTLTSGIAKYKR